MKEIVSFRDLDAWHAGMDLVVATYGIVKRLSPQERRELGAQMRRAAVSISSNVAEGHAGGPRGRFLYHVRIASGSLAELDTQVELAVRLEFLTNANVADIVKQLARTGQLLHGLARSLRRSPGAR